MINNITNKKPVVRNKKPININKSNTLLILDWDDTLFPTSWIVKNNINLNNNKDIQKNLNYFIELDKILFNLFTELQNCGTVIIVTNAMPEWVHISSNILIMTKQLIKNIKILSARKIYQNIIDDAMDWKKYVFHNELVNLTKKLKIYNVISIGDAEYEYKALISLHKKYKYLKSIKFMRNPNHDTLLDQLNVLHNTISQICFKPVHLDMKFKNI